MEAETREALELFVEKAKLLESLSFKKKADEVKFSWAWKKGGGEELEIIGPDSEQIQAFILTLRFFIQDSDHCSFRWLANNVLNDPDVSNTWKQDFQRIRDTLNKYLAQMPKFMPLKINADPAPTCDEIMRIFIYGKHSHVNKQKRETFRKWMSLPKLAQGIMQTQFIQIINTVSKAVSHVSKITEQELKSP